MRPCLKKEKASWDQSFGNFCSKVKREKKRNESDTYIVPHLE